MRTNTEELPRQLPVWRACRGRAQGLSGRALIAGAWRRLSAALSLGLVLYCPAARAECEAGSLPLVVVSFTGEAWTDDFEAAVLDHLRAGLEPTGLRVCPGTESEGSGAGEKPLAAIELRRSAGERVVATIEVRDGVTKKRVARDIDLSALPSDGQSLGIGLAADELLRASWVELSLEDAPEPEQPPPPAVERTVQAAIGRTASPKSEGELRAAVQGYGGGLLLLGGDVAFRHWFSPRVGVEVAFGVRTAPEEEATHGDIAASAIGGSGGLTFAVVRGERARLQLEASVWIAEVRFRGAAVDGSVGSEGAETAVMGRAGVALGYALSRAFLLSARGGLGVPFQAVSARDHGERTVGASSFEWYAALGPAVAF